MAGKVGVVNLNANDIGGLGTAALQDWGTAAGQLPRLDASARLPAIDGSQVLSVNAVKLQSLPVSAIAPVTGQVLGWNGSAWLPANTNAGSVAAVGTGAGLLGGTITTSGTISVDVGTNAQQIPQLDGSARLPAVDASLLLNVNATALQSRGIANVSPAAGQVLSWNQTASQWTPTNAAAGTVTFVQTTGGLLGGPITGSGTLSIDTGTAANQIVKLNTLAQLPAIDGGLLTNVNATFA